MKTLPERMREAAATIEEANVRHGSTAWPAWAPDSLRFYADVWEAKDAEEAAKRAEVDELAKWLATHIGNWPEDEWELRSKPTIYHDRAQELLEAGYRKVEK